MILSAFSLNSVHLLHVGNLSYVSKLSTDTRINAKLHKLEFKRSKTLPKVPSQPQLSNKVGNKFEAKKLLSYVKDFGQSQLVQVAGVMACVFLVIPSAAAVDTLQTYNCLLKGCRIELAKCLSNPSCAANIACLEICNNRPGEIECQMRCGDLFENKVVDEFNKCVVTRKKCVPQKPDNGEYPIPNSAAIVKNFNINDFAGQWYITSGLNPTFDPFDCQLHEFHTESGMLVGTLSWRVKTPGSGFLTRSRIQKFVQEPNQSGILHYYDDEYLHSQDHWYILSSKIENKPDDYVFVYYRGSNDAWDGYGGAVVYSRTATLPESIVPELKRAARRIGRDFDEFIRTDNTCGPEPPFVQQLEAAVREGEETIIRVAQK